VRSHELAAAAADRGAFAEQIVAVDGLEADEGIRRGTTAEKLAGLTALLSEDGVIHAYHLPPSLQSAESTGTVPASGLDAALARLERELLVEALKIEGGNAAAAARRLGITERRMGLSMKRHGVDWRRFRTRA